MPLIIRLRVAQFSLAHFPDFPVGCGLQLLIDKSDSRLVTGRQTALPVTNQFPRARLVFGQFLFPYGMAKPVHVVPRSRASGRRL